MLLGDAVHGGGGDEDDPADSGLARRLEHVLRTADVDGPDRLARGLDRQRGRAVDDDFRSRYELPHPLGVADVPAQLADRVLELRVVERSDVERADVVPVCEQAPRKMQAEEARPAGDGPQH
jgi:hypothetical protein